jgi:predicted transcriptional regulator
VASIIARYRPQLWERILEGLSENEAVFNKRMKKVYEMTSVGEKPDSYYLTFNYQVWEVFDRLLRLE